MTLAPDLVPEPPFAGIRQGAGNQKLAEWFRNMFSARGPDNQRRLQRTTALSIVVLAALIAVVSVLMKADCLDTVHTTNQAAWVKQTLRLEFASTKETAAQVLSDWQQGCSAVAGNGSPWQSEARRSLRWDNVLIVLYVAAGALLLLLTAFNMPTFLLRFLGLLLVWLIAVAGALDAFVENVAMRIMLSDGATNALWPAVTRTAASTKFALLIFGFSYVVVAWSVVLVRKIRGQNAGYSTNSDDKDTDVSVPVDGHALAGATGDAARLEDVAAAELQHICHHRHPEKQAPRVARALVGLALSGGGIRSATTCLGIVQGLAKLGILPFVDYLSTVSGGGYLGGCLSSLLSLNNARVPSQPPLNASAAPADAHLFAPGDRAAFGTDWQNFPFRDDRADVQAARAAQLTSHLRTHGSFLVARRGVLSRDTLRAVGTLLTGMAFSIVSFVVVILAVTAMYLGVVAASVGNASEAFGVVTAAVASDTLQLPGQPSLDTASTTVVRRLVAQCDANTPGCTNTTRQVITPAGFTSWLAYQRERVMAVPRVIMRGASTAETPAIALSREQLRVSAISSLALGALCVLLCFIALLLGLRIFATAKFLAPPQPGESQEEVFDKSILWLLALVTVVFIAIATIAWRQPNLPFAEKLVALWIPLFVILSARVVSWLISIVLPFIVTRATWSRRLRTLWSAFQASLTYGIWIMVAILALAPLMYALAQRGPVLAISSAVALLLTRFLAPSRKSGKPKLKFLPPGLRNGLLGLSVIVVVILGALTFGALLINAGSSDNFKWWALGAVLVTVFLGIFVDNNTVGPHYFYRDRLAETYLLSELPDTARRLWTFRDSMELPLQRLHGDIERPNASAPSGATNAKVATPPTKQELQFRNTAPYQLINAAINLAGSRELARKDRKSGHWLFSKLFCGSIHTGFRPTAVYRGGETKLARAIAISGAAVSGGMGVHTFFAQAFATVLFNLRLGYWTENPGLKRSQDTYEGWIFWPAYVWREISLRTTDRTALVNLSDGGHTGDNCGVYPLLQRRCKVIIVGDAEQDRDIAFGSFTEVLRHAYIDDGIRVDIDLAMIRPDTTTGLSRRHCTVGRIYYPDRPDQESYLIYLKNSLTGDEPAPVQNYKSMCPDFPHETTADQFFTDMQFESYRALGEHIASKTFAKWAGTPPFQFAKNVHAPDPLPAGLE